MNEIRNPPKQWCLKLVNSLVYKLKENGFNANYYYDDEGEPEVIISHKNMITDASCRYFLGDDKDERYCFYSFGISGKGCVQIDTTPDENGIDTAINNFISYNFMMRKDEKDEKTNFWTNIVNRLFRRKRRYTK